jgi:hypothetical protein
MGACDVPDPSSSDLPLPGEEQCEAAMGMFFAMCNNADACSEDGDFCSTMYDRLMNNEYCADGQEMNFDGPDGEGDYGGDFHPDDDHGGDRHEGDYYGGDVETPECVAASSCFDPALFEGSNICPGLQKLMDCEVEVCAGADEAEGREKLELYNRCMCMGGDDEECELLINGHGTDYGGDYGGEDNTFNKEMLQMAIALSAPHCVEDVVATCEFSLFSVMYTEQGAPCADAETDCPAACAAAIAQVQELCVDGEVYGIGGSTIPYSTSGLEERIPTACAGDVENMRCSETATPIYAGLGRGGAEPTGPCAGGAEECSDECRTLVAEFLDGETCNGGDLMVAGTDGRQDTRYPGDKQANKMMMMCVVAAQRASFNTKLTLSLSTQELARLLRGAHAGAHAETRRRRRRGTRQNPVADPGAHAGARPEVQEVQGRHHGACHGCLLLLEHGGRHVRAGVQADHRRDERRHLVRRGRRAHRAASRRYQDVRTPNERTFTYEI